MVSRAARLLRHTIPRCAGSLTTQAHFIPHRLALQPADFGPMRRLLEEAGLPLLFLQEGGYHMENIAAAAAAFWAG